MSEWPIALAGRGTGMGVSQTRTAPIPGIPWDVPGGGSWVAFSAAHSTSYTVRVPHPMPATRTGSPRTLGWRTAILFDAVDCLAVTAAAALTPPRPAA